MILRRSLPSALVGVGALLTAPAAFAQGVWVDIGVDAGTYVHETGGGPSWEYFPPFPFGSVWPAGTLVYAELVAIPCEAMPMGCDPTTFVAGYVARFDGSGCGCGGFISGTCSLRLHYDPSVAAAIGASEAQLVLARWYTDWGAPHWIAVDAAVLHTDDNFVEGSISGSIGSSRYYGIFRSLPVPEVPAVQESTWGRVRMLFR